MGKFSENYEMCEGDNTNLDAVEKKGPFSRDWFLTSIVSLLIATSLGVKVTERGGRFRGTLTV